MGSFYNNQSAEDFVVNTLSLHPEYSFIFHRVDDDYYYPVFCGTIAVKSYGDYNIIIDLQKVTREMIDKMDNGMRPRDWNSFVLGHRNWSKDILEVKYCVDEYQNNYIPFEKLDEIAVKICWIYMRLGIKHMTYTRFNICKKKGIVLNDHRSDSSFTEKGNFKVGLLGNGFFDDISVDTMKKELREKVIIEQEENREDSDVKLRNSGNQRLEGIGASKGIAKGKAYVINNDEKESSSNKQIDLESECILVCDTLSPEIVTRIGRIVGIVTNQGGITSHAAIISRELGVPCVVGTIYGTKLIENGMSIQINGFTGEVFYDV